MGERDIADIDLGERALVLGLRKEQEEQEEEVGGCTL